MQISISVQLNSLNVNSECQSTCLYSLYGVAARSLFHAILDAPESIHMFADAKLALLVVFLDYIRPYP